MPSKYATIEGTEPSEDAPHEARTILRSEDDGSMYMMTEIEDGVFVAWGECRSCSQRVHRCKCKTGPVMADYVARWRDERFEKSVRHRSPSPLKERAAELGVTPVGTDVDIETGKRISLDVAIDAVKAAHAAEEFPQDAEHAKTCVHGNSVWLGHECGICEGDGEYRWQDTDEDVTVEGEHV